MNFFLNSKLEKSLVLIFILSTFLIGGTYEVTLFMDSAVNSCLKSIVGLINSSNAFLIFEEDYLVFGLFFIDSDDDRKPAAVDKDSSNNWKRVSIDTDSGNIRKRAAIDRSSDDESNFNSIDSSDNYVAEVVDLSTLAEENQKLAAPAGKEFLKTQL